MHIRTKRAIAFLAMIVVVVSIPTYAFANQEQSYDGFSVTRAADGTIELLQGDAAPPQELDTQEPKDLSAEQTQRAETEIPANIENEKLLDDGTGTIVQDKKSFSIEDNKLVLSILVSLIAAGIFVKQLLKRAKNGKIENNEYR